MARFSARTFLAIVLGFVLFPVAGEVVDQRGRFADVDLRYKVITPAGWNAEVDCPALLAFAGGAQDEGTVNYFIANNLQREAERRGYLVFVPIAPPGEPFFADGDRVFPAFLEALVKQYRIKGNQFHFAGRSNGGLSAFHIAVRYPQFVLSVTGFPGVILPEDAEAVEALRPIRLAMAAGDGDPGWFSTARDQAAWLTAHGFQATFVPMAGVGHELTPFLGEGSSRLFDLIEGRPTLANSAN